MQCAKCQTTIEPSASGATPAACPKCGAPLASASKSNRPGGRPGGVSGLSLMLLALLLAVAAVAVASSYFAVLAMRKQKAAEESLAAASTAMETLVVATASNDKLKGAANLRARQEILQPAIDYYQVVAYKDPDDPQMLPEMAKARLQLAALQAKAGKAECVSSLNDALQAINLMIKDGSFGEQDYPAFQAHVTRLVAPTDWMQVQAEDRMAFGVGLFLGIQAGISTYKDLAQQYPKNVAFRDDAAALLQASAMLQQAIGRTAGAAANWTEAGDLLESLVRDRPDNAEFKTRLAESLTSAARLQAAAEADKALENLKRAVEVRQQLADAKPDDQAAAKELETAKSNVEKLEAKIAQAKDAPKPEAKTEAKTEAPQKDDAGGEPAKEEPPAEAPAEAPEEAPEPTDKPSGN